MMAPGIWKLLMKSRTYVTHLRLVTLMIIPLNAFDVPSILLFCTMLTVMMS